MSLAGGHPPVALPVGADEHLGLGEIGAVHRAPSSNMIGVSRSCSTARLLALVRQLTQRRRNKDPKPAGGHLDLRRWHSFWTSRRSRSEVSYESPSTERLRSPRRSRSDPGSLAESAIGDLGLRPSGLGR
jgi:hypothetical protein